MATGNDDSPQPGRFERAIPLRESKGPIGPFKATKIWNALIEHLKCKVELKRRRHKMKSIDACFTGTDAVDVVLHFLLNDKDTFSNDLSREKAVKVCQMLMQRKVFQSAMEKSGSEKVPFEDSSNKYYLFIGEHAMENSIPEDVDEGTSGNPPVNENINCLAQSLEKAKITDDKAELAEEPKGKTRTIQPLQDLHNNRDSTRMMPDLTGGASGFFGSDFPVTPHRLVNSLSADEVEETWREIALTQLLTIVDLTFLDGVLSEDKQSRNQQQRHHLIISNIVARNWNQPLTPSNLKARTDPLLQTAMDCIEFLPKGPSLLNEPVFKRQGVEAKLWAKDVIKKHYTSLEDSLLPSKFLELHMAILNLILDNNIDTAVSALQLYVILLPVTAREELYRLLCFMHSVASDTSLHLDPMDSNEVVILHEMTSSIFQHKLLASNLSQKLVQLMMSRVEEVFTVPRPLRKKVAIRLYQLKTGKSLLACESSFCNRVSKEEYERQSKDCTEEALIDLMNSVIDDPNLTVKEKKQKLKQFQKTYPELYDQNFNGML